MAKQEFTMRNVRCFVQMWNAFLSFGFCVDHQQSRAKYFKYMSKTMSVKSRRKTFIFCLKEIRILYLFAPHLNRFFSLQKILPLPTHTYWVNVILNNTETTTFSAPRLFLSPQLSSNKEEKSKQQHRIESKRVASVYKTFVLIVIHVWLWHILAHFMLEHEQFQQFP